MLKNLFVMTLAVLCLFVFANTSFSQHKQAVGFIKNGDVISGNTQHPIYSGPPVIFTDPPGKRTYQVDGFTITVQEVNQNGRTYYNLQSNGCPQDIWQDPNTVGNVHAVFMVDPNGATGYPGRRTRYFFSSDTGHTWTYVSEVPSTSSVRSGYPYVIVLSNGKQLVANHTTDGGSVLHAQLYVETGSPGDGLFSRMDPGLVGPSDDPIWPRLSPTSSVSNTNKVIFVASEQTSDSCYKNIATGFGATGPFVGYSQIGNAAAAEQQAVALGPNNTVAIAYICDGTLNPSIPNGAVECIISTNNGSTWGTPVRIYTPNYSVSGLGALRSISARYLGNNLRVLFGLVVFDPSTGGFYPDSTAIEKVWGSDLNGGVPVTVDSSSGMLGSNSLNGSDVFTSLCRGALGTSPDGVLYATYVKARSDTSSVGDNFFDVWIAVSGDGGLTWPSSFKTRVTNLSGPLRDCKWPSISPVNYPSTSSHHVAHIIYLSDSLPGSNINGGILQLARMMYARVTYDGPIGIINLGSEVPKQFALYQNYPNPFNPSTNIKFSLPTSTFVTLKIYDILGREVITLINDYVPAGNKVYTYDASGLASGIYFYTLKAGDFRDTKKMILVK